jgi:hypothetical protein
VERSDVSFAKDIRPLFRDIDVAHMSKMQVLLDDYAYMSDPANAQSVYEFLDGTRQPQMPPNGPYWSPDQLNLYKSWLQGGRRP